MYNKASYTDTEEQRSSDSFQCNRPVGASASKTLAIYFVNREDYNKAKSLRKPCEAFTANITGSTGENSTDKGKRKQNNEQSMEEPEHGSIYLSFPTHKVTTAMANAINPLHSHAHVQWHALGDLGPCTADQLSQPFRLCINIKKIR